jgi:PAS domain S-box-containing protein
MTRRLLPLLEPLAVAFQVARDALFVFDRGTLLIRHVNPAAERLSGRAAGELVDRPLCEVLHAEPAEALACLLRGPGGPAPHRVWLHRGPDRAAVAVRLVVPPAATEAHGLAVVHPTEEEDQARREARQWRSLVENAPDIILILDADGTIRFINRIAPGLRSEEVLGRNALDFITAGCRPTVEQALRTALATGQPADYDVDAVEPRGVIRYHGRVIRLQPSADVQPAGSPQAAPAQLLVIARDVTERKRAEEENRLSERKLQETARLESLGVLAGGIAHDFNNLLTGILGYASLTRMQLPPGSPLVHHLEQIEHGAHRAADLCTQMLAYAGKGRFVLAHVNLNALIAESTQLLHLSISKNALLQCDLAPALPPILADANQIRQALLNLVINASESLGAGEGVIRVATGVSRLDQAALAGAHLNAGLSEGDSVFLEVRDTGCGMTAEMQERIFEPFFMTKFTGRGLGLAAVLGIVRAHEGAIQVTSEVSRGTTFRLFFPCAGSPDKADLPGGDIRWQGEGDVLVVDDEQGVREVAAQMLEAVGFRVTLAGDGREAATLFRSRGPFRFVLLDLTMPHQGGAETFQQLRALSPDVPVILMSGYSEQEATAHFVGQGLAGFLPKPFKAAALLRVVRQVLEPPT